jgi:phosphoenolpyruvate carboxylase
MVPADSLPSFLRIGSWIGGDRDGNPFVTEEVLRAALRAQSSRALRYYLDEINLLGGELSLDIGLVGVTDALEELAARSPDRSTLLQPQTARTQPEYLEAMEYLSAEAYRGLVYETDGFDRSSASRR